MPGTENPDDAVPELVEDPELELEINDDVAKLSVALLEIMLVPAADVAAPVCSGIPENVCVTVTAEAVLLTSGIPLEISWMSLEPGLKLVCARPIVLAPRS